MIDFFYEQLAMQRIELVARLVVNSSGHCNESDKELALNWIAELTTELVDDLNEQQKNHS